jgi:hypothetical protein
MRANGIAVVALSLALAATGCHKRVPKTAGPVPPPPAPPPAAVPAPIEIPEPAPVANVPVVPNLPDLEPANRAFSAGNYDEAAKLYDAYLQTTTRGGGERDRALFNYALIYALRPAPATDWSKAVNTFKQLVDEFPNSPLKAPASVILGLHAEVDQAGMDIKQRDLRIRQLTTELDRLKKIDADRRKRP